MSTKIKKIRNCTRCKKPETEVAFYKTGGYCKVHARQEFKERAARKRQEAGRRQIRGNRMVDDDGTHDRYDRQVEARQVADEILGPVIERLLRYGPRRAAEGLTLLETRIPKEYHDDFVAIKNAIRIIGEYKTRMTMGEI